MDTLYIKKMMIDGENVSPTKSYNFPEKGNHTVYFRFHFGQLFIIIICFLAKKELYQQLF